jgi:hypothetical protein
MPEMLSTASFVATLPEMYHCTSKTCAVPNAQSLMVVTTAVAGAEETPIMNTSDAKAAVSCVVFFIGSFEGVEDRFGSTHINTRIVFCALT